MIETMIAPDLKKFLLPLLLAGFLMFASQMCWAQGPGITHFDVDNGLPSSTVYRVFQDSKGFIWFATNCGVTRFDGNRFRVFTKEDGLTENDVINIFEDSHGKIWFLTTGNGPCYFQDGKIGNPSNDKRLAGYTSKDLILSMSENSKGDLFFLVRPVGGSLCRYGYYNPLIKNPRLDCCDSVSVYFFNRDANPEGSGSYNKFRFEEKKIHLGPQIPAVTDLGNPASQQLSENGKSVVFYRNIHSVVRFDSTGQTVLFDFPGIQVNNIEIFSNGDLMLCSTTGAFLFFNDGKGGFAREPKIYFPGRPITSSIRDIEGNLWFSDLEQGAFFLKTSGVVNINRDSGLPIHFVRSLTFVDGKALINSGQEVALSEGGIYRWKPEIFWAKADVNGFEQRNQFLFKTGMSFFFFSVADLEVGFERYKQFESGELSKGGMQMPAVETWGTKKFGSVKNVIMAEGNNVYFSSNYGIFRTHPQPNPLRFDTLYEGRVSSMTEVVNDRFCFTTPKGAFWFFLKTGELKPVSEKQEFSQSFVTACLRPDMTLWLGTNGSGVYVHKGEEFQHYTTENGLGSNTIRKIVPAPDGSIWFCTNEGLSKFQPAEPGGSPGFKKITTTDGLISNHVNDIDFLGDSIYVSTASGISVFKENAFVKEMRPPPVYIVSLSVEGRDTLLNQGLRLRSNTASIVFSFVGLSFSSLGRMSYKFRLIGLDTTWIQTQIPEARFNFLPPGDFTFQVMALNKDGVMSVAPAEFKFTISTPWHKRTWVRISGLLLLAALIWLVAYLRYKNRDFREQLTRKAMEAEQKALIAQMNPHFLFNSMNSIQKFLATNERKEAITYFSRFGRLVRIMLDSSRKQFISLEDEIQALTLYAQIEQLRTENKFKFVIEADPNLNLPNLKIPPMLIQPYIENSIWHGVMSKDSPGCIVVKFSDGGQFIRCSVEDDGVGREMAARIKAEKGATHQSHGTQITEERLKLLSDNRTHADNRVTFTDLRDPEGNPCGTRVEFNIPLLNL